MKKKQSISPNKKHSVRRIYRIARVGDMEIGSEQMTESTMRGVEALKVIGMRDTSDSLDECFNDVISHANNLAEALEAAEGDLTRMDFEMSFPPETRELIVDLLEDAFLCHNVGITDEVRLNALQLIHNMTDYVVRMQRMQKGDYRDPSRGTARGFFPQLRPV